MPQQQMSPQVRREFYDQLTKNPLYRELHEYISTFAALRPSGMALTDNGSILQRERAIGVQLNAQETLDFINTELKDGGDDSQDDKNETTADTPEP